MPERRLVRKGNRQYERKDYDSSIDNYSRALRHDPTSFEAKFNTANVQFRKAFVDSLQMDVKMLEKAEKSLRKLAQDSTRTDIERADVAYNLGNSLFAQQKFKEALTCYRDAMRLNPEDKEAKYNYALTKEMLKQQQQQQQQQEQNQDQNQDNQDKQDQENQQDKQDQQDKEDKQEQQDKEDKQNQQQPNEQQISEQEQQAMLEAIQAQEDKTQEKLKEKQGVVIRGGKNW
ncbi:MAG: tetratricopeptide repeat protein [Rikenellaceae bacterium]|nr:tetratricopeptide repeat protein [Rikenellaceae bacterium]